jgi:hypothetical protein
LSSLLVPDRVPGRFSFVFLPVPGSFFLYLEFIVLETKKLQLETQLKMEDLNKESFLKGLEGLNFRDRLKTIEIVGKKLSQEKALALITSLRQVLPIYR